MAQVRIGNKLYDENQMFNLQLDSVVWNPNDQWTAAQAAAAYNNTSVYGRGNTTSAGELQGITPVGTPKKKEALAPAPRPSAPKKSVLSPAAPPPAPLNQEVTQKERDEVTKPAKGLESTIKTTPTLLREKRRKSYLTAGG